jgi:hypothetical protein
VASRFARYFDYPQGRVDYLTHISRRHAAVFVEVPKAGCTVVKRVLQASENGGALPPDLVSVHDRSTSPLAAPLRDGFDVEEVFGAGSRFFRFAFVRNPYSRALSCYLEKIAGAQWLRDLRLPKLGFQPDEEITFSQFLRRVADQEPSAMDIHWAPQSFLLALPKVEYAFLGRFESFHADLEALRRHLGLQAPASLFSERTQHTTGARSRISAHFDRETVDLVRGIYHEDFQRLGYGLDPRLA